MIPTIKLSFFFNDPATTEIYTLSLHDALPIFRHLDPPSQVAQERHELAAAARHGAVGEEVPHDPPLGGLVEVGHHRPAADRKSTRLNSSHANISYAVFCLKKKNQ